MFSPFLWFSHFCCGWLNWWRENTPGMHTLQVIFYSNTPLGKLSLALYVPTTPSLQDQLRDCLSGKQNEVPSNLCRASFLQYVNIPLCTSKDLCRLWGRSLRWGDYSALPNGVQSGHTDPQKWAPSPALIRGKCEWGRLLRDVLKMEADESNS